MLLAIFFFLVFAEEVSWGQRIFSWATPEAWSQINTHHETNIHNLFDAGKFTPERFLTIFVATYGVFLPLADRYWPRAEAFIDWTGVPVPPVATVGLFLTVLVLYRYLSLYYPHEISPVAKPLREYHEAGYAGVFLVVAITFFLDRWGSNRAAPEPPR